MQVCRLCCYFPIVQSPLVPKVIEVFLLLWKRLIAPLPYYPQDHEGYSFSGMLSKNLKKAYERTSAQWRHWRTKYGEHLMTCRRLRCLLAAVAFRKARSCLQISSVLQLPFMVRLKSHAGYWKNGELFTRTDQPVPTSEICTWAYRSHKTSNSH